MTGSPPLLPKTALPLLERLTQRRVPEDASSTAFSRCLGVFDLVNSGFSIVVGAGIFVITPVLTAHTTGPAVTLSYVIAGLAALVSALTYAELAGRFQGIGSAYLFVYYVLGELAAGIIGISMVIEFMIGLASLIKSLSIYSDQLLFNGTVIAWESVHFAVDIPYMCKYVDLLGLAILLVCGLLNLWGVKQTVVVSALCNVVVVVSLVLVIIMGFSRGTTDNWFHAIPPPELPGFGSGGYFPYGGAGVLTGASLAYFSYGGFDAIACLGCEARKPQKDIPLSIVLTFGLVMTLYLLVCSAITYVAPYYSISGEAGMALAFSGLPWVVLVISLGACLATATGSFASVMTTSRIVFSMAQDGIIFKKLTYVSETGVPVVAILTSMVLPALGIVLLDIEELVMMNSGGSLICFCLTNICVIVGRYQPKGNLRMGTYSTPELYSITIGLLFWVCSLLSNFCLKSLGLGFLGITLGIFFMVLGLGLLFFMRCNLTEEEQNLDFKCPGVPWLPGAGIFINSSLMVSLPLTTWVRVGVCVALGLVCYVVYGLRHSTVTVNKLAVSADDNINTIDMDLRTRSPASYNDLDCLLTAGG